MSLYGLSHSKPPFTSQDDQARRVLAQLYREQVVTGCHSALYSELCEEAGIPTVLRAALLDRLVREQYLTQERFGLVRLTESGTLLATAPRP